MKNLKNMNLTPGAQRVTSGRPSWWAMAGMVATGAILSPWVIRAWRNSRRRTATRVANDQLVDLMSEDSFPASDPPAYTTGRRQ